MTDSAKKKWKLPLIILGAAIAIMILLFLTKPSPPTVATKEKAWLVDVVPVRLGANHPTLSLLGSVTSPFDAELSSVIQADVLNVPVREGDAVEQDQLLIVLDKRDIQSLVTQRQADLTELKASLKAEMNRYASDQKALKEEQKLLQVARDALARQARLKSSNLVAQERLEQAESQVAQSALSVTSRQQAIDDHPNRMKQVEAKISRAQALLNDAERDLTRSQILAPFDGVVTSVQVSPGERVQIGQTLASLYDLDQAEVRAQIPDKYLSIIRQALLENQNITARAVYQGQALEFDLDRISGQSNAGAGGVDAFFRPLVTNVPLILDSAIRLNTLLPALPNTFTLPISAIYGTNRVYRVEDERIQAVSVEILGQLVNEAGETQVIIKQGELSENDQIIITQLPNAISGLKVELKDKVSAEAGEQGATNAL